MSGSDGVFIETPASKVRYYQDQQQQQQQQQRQEPPLQNGQNTQQQQQHYQPGMLEPYQGLFFLIHVFLFTLLLSALARVYVIRTLRWLSVAFARASQVLSGVGGKK